LGVAFLLATLFTAWTEPGLLPSSLSEKLDAALAAQSTTPQPDWPTPTARPNPRIGIVAGHSGNDPGAVCPDELGGIREVDINLTVAQKVKESLTAEGFDVDLLAEFDPRLVGYRALALVSIHADSCQYVNDEATGFKVAAALSTFYPEQATRLTTCVRTRYADITGLRFHAGSVTNDMTNYHAFGEINTETPAAIIKSFSKTEDPDRVQTAGERHHRRHLVLCAQRRYCAIWRARRRSRRRSHTQRCAMTPPLDPATQQALENARQAFRRGDRRAARYWAQQAAALAPHLEEPWLWLAASASPRASLDYLARALAINPRSKRARQGMHWAIRRLRADPDARARSRPPAVAPRLAASPAVPLGRTAPSWIMLLLAVFSLLAAAWLGQPVLSSMGIGLGQVVPALPLAEAFLDKVTHTPTVTPTPTATATATPTPTATATPTATPVPTDTPEPTDPPPYGELPEGIGDGDRWVDVDLSEQRVYAYEGAKLENEFLASTGTWLHPTITGQFHIYVKYTSTPMWGPGYYLPGVPYTMYYDQGYALHGTYWHNNFGTPMSHGCINLRTEDAGWLFEWASVGTLVNIHE
jgi:lipoprotein-anchoring transpeptidase ErfK/SrfK/N-acetylmuramoyl-L-alanine amidase